MEPRSEPFSNRGEAGEADALISLSREVSPAVLVADCVPLLIANESGSLSAAVHIGHRGLMSGLAPLVIERLHTETSEPLFAVAGPHICTGCYEVGEDLAAEAVRFGAAATTRWSTPSIDLAAGLRRQLVGVHLEVLPICTFEDEELFSYRRERITGRFAGIAVADTPKRINDIPPALQ